jgi:hypothetical protein
MVQTTKSTDGSHHKVDADKGLVAGNAYELFNFLLRFKANYSLAKVFEADNTKGTTDFFVNQEISTGITTSNSEITSSSASSSKEVT